MKNEVLSKTAITIDPEFRDLCPPLTTEEREGLRDSLEKDGLMTPLIVWKHQGETILIDGHNRYEIITDDLDGRDYEGEAIELTTKEIFFRTRESAHNWIIKNQLARRNLSPDAAAILRGKLYNSRKQSVPNPEGIGGKSAKIVGGKSCPQQKTAQQVAKETGVSERTVKNDSVFASAAERVGATKAIMAGTEKRSRKEIIAAANGHKPTPKPTATLEERMERAWGGFVEKFAVTDHEALRVFIAGKLKQKAL